MTKKLQAGLWVIFLGLVSVFLYDTFGNEEQTTSREGLIPVELVKTIDGDTIKIMYDGKEQNVRYLLIDTPETNHPRLGKQPFGEEAKARNDELIRSGKLEIEFDIGERVDKYGRLLAYIYVDGESVQEKLLEEGLARVAYVYPPNTRHLDPYEKAQATAKKMGLGIWSIEDYATERGFDSDAHDEEKTEEVPTSGPVESFKNCTDLRKKYPHGVKKGHPAYSERMDGDRDGYACE
ncbi:thermonuclease family protein [Sporosarcina sp. 179-K 3D1 HS]|uniref:thermonuclease family protein n=1 Tax=Sporosarcina sp. 179-K 3D1 HS TaxID=3232169 RepID=UPI0039A2BEC0